MRRIFFLRKLLLDYLACLALPSFKRIYFRTEVSCTKVRKYESTLHGTKSDETFSVDCLHPSMPTHMHMYMHMHMHNKSIIFIDWQTQTQKQTELSTRHKTDRSFQEVIN